MDRVVVGSGKNRLLTEKRPSPRAISQRKRDDFILHLSETCNVTLSAERVGVAFATFYKIRQRDAAFAAAWQSALDDGYLPSNFVEAMVTSYGGTRLGRQELDGELIADREDALWSRARLEAIRLRHAGPLSRIVVAVDPPATASAASVCGIVVAGLDGAGRAVVLADCSVTGASPAGWAGAVVRAFRRFDADRVVAEINQGGDMVTAMLKSVEADLPVTTVRATRGKFLRAEPVAALYEQGRVAHAGAFAELEDQMCDFGPDGLSAGRSPDRLDALVWALTALVLDRQGEPRVRGI